MTTTRRILITGLSSHWGGRLAQLLERDAELEAIIGIDSSDPRHELHRTEFVRVDAQPALLRRIINAARIDTVVDTRLVSDPLQHGLQRAHEINVPGTINVLSACAGHDSPVRKLVFKSSAGYYGSDAADPAFFTEEMAPSRPPRTEIESDIAGAEEAVSEFAARNRHVAITILRVAAAVGDEITSPHLSLLNLPVVPGILGFDPRYQFIHEDDVVGVLEHAVRHDIPGVYNAAADGVLTLSEIVATLGKPLIPVLPPWGTGFAAQQLRRLGLRIPVELIHELRYGRGLDNRRLKASGYAYRYTTREAILKLRAQQRLRPLLRSGGAPYQYEREVEEFLRWSPSVRTAPVVPGEGDAAGADPATDHGAAPPGKPFATYDDLTARELADLIPSLEPAALAQLRRYEEASRARKQVLDALDRAIARKAGSGTQR
jgi:UDP-glucose 4-epimerase